MVAYGNLILRSALAVVILLSVSCVHNVHLRSPRNAETIEEIGPNASPVFAWRSSYGIRRPGDYQEFSLTVARDRSFRNVVYEKDKIESQSFTIDPEEGWLPGGPEGTYFWKVEGVVRDEDANERAFLPCEKVRTFKLERRQTVEVHMSVPEGFEARIGGKGDFTTKTIVAEIENGERREVEIRTVLSPPEEMESAGGFGSSDPREMIELSGHIWVRNVNENTKYGKITINNVEADRLRQIAEGDVGNFSYQLGGERIVEMKLGGKVLSSN